MKNQKTKFYIGTLLISVALFCVTFLPFILKEISIELVIEEFIFVQIEFILMLLASILYLNSPRYYDNQLAIISFGILYYFLFVKFLANIF